jgi:hypothetical protein
MSLDFWTDREAFERAFAGTAEEQEQEELDLAAYRQDMEQREHEAVAAIREALTKGVSSKNIRVLCSECGVRYEQVVE